MSRDYKLTSYGLTVDRLNAADRSVITFPAFILAALLSFGTVNAEPVNTGDMLRDIFHSEAAQFNFNPETRKFSHSRQACTDSILIRANSRGWQSLADRGALETSGDVIAFRPTIRQIFADLCGAVS